MKGKTRRYLPLALLTAAAAGLQLAVRRFIQRPLPPLSGDLRVAGLHRPVEIIRDTWGVPHIYAQNEHDLFFAQGFVHAQDRLFQMDANRRVGAGRISEIVGPLGLPSDRFARFYGWTRAADAQLFRSDPDTREMVDAYAGGVNAFIAQNRLPVEFSVLAYRPEPWSAQDSAAWGTVLAWGLSVNWETELLRARLLAHLGPDKLGDFIPLYEDDYPTILPDATISARLAAAFQTAYAEAAAYWPVKGSGLGSNNWALSGQRTASGRPILANDPHLPPIFPTIWYENHLVGGRFNVTGFTMPGIPGVVIGHNEHIAWGVTNAFPDVQDVYIERFHPDDPTRYEVDGRYFDAEIVEETIKVRGRKPIVEKVRYTRHGPVFSDMMPEVDQDLSLRWAAYGRTNHMLALFNLNLAHDWGSFRDSLQCWGFPSQNIVYADVAGNIGYTMPGLVPQRQKGIGLLPVPGWTEGFEWTGWIPYDELPTAFNPSEGFIVTANNKIVGDSYPHLLTTEWLPGYRAQRIRQLLSAKDRLTLMDNANIQRDTVSLFALRFMRAALPLMNDADFPDDTAVHALRILRQWDGDMRADRVAPSLYFSWFAHFNTAVMRLALGQELADSLLFREETTEFSSNPFHRISPELSLTWLEQGPPDWLGAVQPLLRPAFRQTLADLRQRFGPRLTNWTWGRLHQLNLHNYLTRIPALGRLWKPITLSLSGDGFSVNQSDVGPVFPPHPVHIIASCRMLIDVGGWDNSLAALPGGQSGQFASPHYQDSAQDWQYGRYHPMLFSRHHIEAAAEGQLLLKP